MQCETEMDAAFTQFTGLITALNTENILDTAKFIGELTDTFIGIS